MIAKLVWHARNPLLWVALFCGGTVFAIVVLRIQTADVREHGHESRYYAKGYFEHLRRLRDAGELPRDANGEVVPGERAQAFATRSALKEDLARYARSRSGPLAALFLEESTGQTRLLEMDHFTTLAQTRWSGRVTYRLSREPSAILSRGDDQRLVELRPTKTLRNSRGRWNPGAFLVPAPEQERWHLEGGQEEGAVEAAPGWTVLVGNRQVLHNVSFLGLEDVVCGLEDLPEEVTQTLRPTLNGIPFSRWVRGDTKERRRSRVLRLEDGDLFTFQVGGKRQSLLFHHLPAGAPHPGGTLSSRRWTRNGPKRSTAPDGNALGPGVAASLDRYFANVRPDIRGIDGDVELSLDRAVTVAMRGALDEFARSHRPGPSQSLVLAATVLDGNTGEVLAIPSLAVHREDGENWNFIAHSPGSAWKIPLYAAALSVEPGLSDFRFRFGSNGFSEQGAFAGEPGRAAPVRILGEELGTFHEPGPPSPSTLGLEDAIRYSSNVYAVSMAILSSFGGRADDPLARQIRAGRTDFTTGAWNFVEEPIFRRHAFLGPENRVGFFESSPLAQRLRELFDVRPAYAELRYDPGPWQDLPANIGATPTLLGEFENGLVAPTQQGLGFDLVRDNFRGQLVPLCLGQGNNLWSNVKMAETFARIFSGRRIVARLIPAAGDVKAERLASFMPAAVHQRLLKALAGPVSNGTAKDLASLRAELSHRGISLYGKTGTAEPVDGITQGSFVGVVERGNEPGGDRDRLVFVIYARGQGVSSSADAVHIARAAIPRVLRALPDWSTLRAGKEKG